MTFRLISIYETYMNLRLILERKKKLLNISWRFKTIKSKKKQNLVFKILLKYQGNNSKYMQRILYELAVC